MNFHKILFSEYFNRLDVSKISQSDEQDNEQEEVQWKLWLEDIGFIPISADKKFSGIFLHLKAFLFDYFFTRCLLKSTL